MKKIFFIVFISLIISSCINIDPNHSDLSKSQQNFKEDKSYLFSRYSSYSTKYKNREYPINDLAQYFYSYDKNAEYVKLTPKFNSNELKIEILNANKKIIQERNFKLLPYSKENLDKNSKSDDTIYYANNNREIYKKTSSCIADLAQSCSFYTTSIFLDRNENLVIASKTTGVGLIFLIPVAGKSIFIDIFNKIE